jgi:hypothetical protein
MTNVWYLFVMSSYVEAFAEAIPYHLGKELLTRTISGV